MVVEKQTTTTKLMALRNILFLLLIFNIYAFLFFDAYSSLADMIDWRSKDAEQRRGVAALPSGRLERFYFLRHLAPRIKTPIPSKKE
jgi:hypothetical protein